MSATKQFIEPYLSARTEIIINGENDTITFVDWDALSEDMGDDYTDILDYFVDDEMCEDRIATGDWKPFGLLGLMHNPDSYSEMGNNGLLLFDVSDEEATNPSIVLWKEGEATVIAQHFSELEISVVEEEE